MYINLKSGNKKTGPIPVSTSPAETCPDACPFKRNGCYADGGPLRMHWDKVTAKQRGTGWAQFIATVEAIKDGQIWRHNQAGDLAGIGNRIDGPKLRQLTQANKGKRGFTYTHKPARGNNLKAIVRANREGFTVNVSANSIAHADMLSDIGRNASALGVPVVTVLPAGWTKRRHVTPAGNTIIQCPATYRETTCEECGLCQVATRKSIVGFPAHGSSKRKASTVAEGGE